MAVLAALIVVSAPVYACLGPANVFGVRFNDHESIDLAIIEKIGELGINYLKKEEHGIKTYSFRSHHNASIMINIDMLVDSAPPQGADLSFVVDTSKIQMQGLALDSCVRVELDWLASAGIIELTRIERENIQNAPWKMFSHPSWDHSVGGFYWTRQDTLIENNCIITEDGKIACTSNSCGEMEAVILPPQTLVITTGIFTRNHKTRQPTQRLACYNHYSVRLLDIRGRMLQHATDNREMTPCGIVLLQDRNSGVIKRVVALP